MTWQQVLGWQLVAGLLLAAVVISTVIVAIVITERRHDARMQCLRSEYELFCFRREHGIAVVVPLDRVR